MIDHDDRYAKMWHPFPILSNFIDCHYSNLILCSSTMRQPAAFTIVSGYELNDLVFFPIRPVVDVFY